jgi:hypothetical protein
VQITKPVKPWSLIKRLLPAPITVIGKWRSLAHASPSASSNDDRGAVKYSAAPPTRIEVRFARDSLARIKKLVGKSSDMGLRSKLNLN